MEPGELAGELLPMDDCVCCVCPEGWPPEERFWLLPMDEAFCDGLLPDGLLPLGLLPLGLEPEGLEPEGRLPVGFVPEGGRVLPVLVAGGREAAVVVAALRKQRPQ